MITLHRTAWLLLLALALAACSSGANKASSQRPAGSSDTEAWFCQTGEPAETWECVQSESLSRSPQPSRSPPKPEPLADPPFPAAPAPTLAPAPVRQTISPTVPDLSTPAPAPVVDTEQLPPHIALAYQPAKPVPLSELPGRFWAVQLVALSSKQALEDFATQHNIQGMSAARIAVREDLFYVLLLGIYETRARAERASADLPAPFDKPWIRSLGSLQTAMQAADQLTGSAGP